MLRAYLNESWKAQGRLVIVEAHGAPTEVAAQTDSPNATYSDGAEGSINEFVNSAVLDLGSFGD